MGFVRSLRASPSTVGGVPSPRAGAGVDVVGDAVARRHGVEAPAVSGLGAERDRAPATAVERGAPVTAAQGGDAHAVVAGVQGGPSRGATSALLPQVALPRPRRVRARPRPHQRYRIGVGTAPARHVRHLAPCLAQAPSALLERGDLPPQRGEGAHSYPGRPHRLPLQGVRSTAHLPPAPG